MNGVEKAPSDDCVARLFGSVLKIRKVEEAVASLYPSDVIKSPVHLSIGQESVAVGVIDLLDGADVVAGTYRGHASYIAKGGSLPAMFAELFGKAQGCAGGKGGSMHLVGMEQKILGCSAVVASHIPIAAGYALAIQQRHEQQVVVCFFGDGATEEGVFAETLNFAALRKLPILFVCENNGLAIHTPIQKRWASEHLVERVRTYGIKAENVTSYDIMAVRSAAALMLDYVRAGHGPAFLECRTLRFKEHVGPSQDFEAGYREPFPLDIWPANDPVEVLGARLSPAERDRIVARVEGEIADAIRFAQESPVPPLAEAFTQVFAQ